MADRNLLVEAGLLAPIPRESSNSFQAQRQEPQAAVSVEQKQTPAKPRRSNEAKTAEVLIRLAQQAELFHTRSGDCYALIPVDSHKECWPVRSKAFRKWLCRQYFRKTKGKVPNSEAIQNALNVIEAEAQFDGPQKEVHTRIAEANGNIYLDLCNEKWEAVEITKSAWRIVSDPPVRFRRAEGMLSLPHPKEGGSLDDLRNLVNASDDRTWMREGIL